MNKREEFDWTPIYIIGTGLIILFLTILVFQGKIGPDGFVVGTGTFLLAIATFHLANIERAESRQNRKQDKHLAEKDRLRLRLKEQLEGLYSPLMGIGKEDFIIQPNHRYEAPRGDQWGPDPNYVHEIMVEMRSKYKYLADDELKKALDFYYTKELDYGETLGKEEWSALIEDLWDRITEGFDMRSIEYSNLVKA